MKTTDKMVYGVRCTVYGVVAMLLIAGNAQAVDFKNTYQGMEQKTNPMEYRVATTATAPSAYFQSTSVYSGQWNQDAQQSMLNADGTVNSDAYGVGQSTVISRPRRVDANGDGIDDETGLPVNPIIDKDDEGNVPLGDGLLVLMALAMAYAGTRIWRARRMRSAEE